MKKLKVLYMSNNLVKDWGKPFQSILQLPTNYGECMSKQVKKQVSMSSGLSFTDKPAEVHRIPKYFMQEIKNRKLNLNSKPNGVCSLNHLAWTSFEMCTCSLTCSQFKSK